MDSSGYTEKIRVQKERGTREKSMLFVWWFRNA